MNPIVNAYLWWGLLGIAILLSFLAVPLRSWRLALLAAICSFAFALAALASFGALVLLVTGLQLLIAFLLYRLSQPAQRTQ